MDQRTPDELDAVALGLKRGPRGAVALVLIAALAVVGGVVATTARSRPEPVASADEELVELPALAPTPQPKAQKKKTNKKVASLSGRAVGVRERKPPPSEAPKPVVAEQAKPVEVEVARVEPAPQPQEPEPQPEVVAEPLVPPPPPAPEPEAVEEPEPVAAVEQPIEVDGNGAAIAKLIAASKRAAVRACFESELKQTPKLRGTVVVELDLAPPNKVNEVRVSDDLERPAFTRCVRNTMQTIRFTGLDEELSVSVPYTLTPQSK